MTRCHNLRIIPLFKIKEMPFQNKYPIYYAFETTGVSSDFEIASHGPYLCKVSLY